MHAGMRYISLADDAYADLLFLLLLRIIPFVGGRVACSVKLIILPGL
jgi:hypothetical protein